MIQILLETGAEVTAADISTQSILALAPSKNSKSTDPYWAHHMSVGLIRNLGSADMVITDVRRLLEGAIAEETARLGEAAEVGGVPDVAIVDTDGARLL
jgi:hypothetical protein